MRSTQMLSLWNMTLLAPEILNLRHAPKDKTVVLEPNRPN